MNHSKRNRFLAIRNLQRRKQKSLIRRTLIVEGLERRELLAGLTIISHGFTPNLSNSPSYPAWPVAIGQAILDRADGPDTTRSTGNIFVSQPSLDNSTSSTVPLWQSIDTLAPVGGPSIWNNSNDADQETVLLFNWVDESDRPESGWLNAAADSLVASLL